MNQYRRNRELDIEGPETPRNCPDTPLEVLENIEPILVETKSRFVLFPIHHQDIWNMAKLAEASVWTVSEIDLGQDQKDWDNLSNDERHFIKYVLAFFAASDGIVIENLVSRFISEVKYPEARFFYGFQDAMENVHSETYSVLIDTYIKNSDEKNHLFNAIDEIPCIKGKADWAIRWMHSNNSFAERLVAFACVEGIFFSGSFCAIFWFKKRGMLPGLATANEFISRDESLHTQFAVLLYKNHIKHKLTQQRIYEIVSSAVKIEKQFICESLPVRLIGMNNELMSQYIEFVADYLIVSLGHEKLFNTTNPFDFMHMISLQGKTNFFEKVTTDYQKAGVMNSTDNKVFTTDDDF